MQGKVYCTKARQIVVSGDDTWMIDCYPTRTSFVSDTAFCQGMWLNGSVNEKQWYEHASLWYARNILGSQLDNKKPGKLN